MATPRAIAMITLHRKSGLSEDRVVNVMHFEADDQVAQDDFEVKAPGLADRLAVFYQTLGPRLSGVLSGVGDVKLYDWRAAKPRVPRFESTFTFATGSGSLPAEVALCMSYAAAPASGMNMARRRGRIYLGPWAGNQGGSADLGDVRPAASAISQITTAGKVMARGSSGSFRLAVYSPTQGGINGQGDNAWNDAVNVSVDDAWDTQRSRGAAPLARTTLLL